MGFGELISKEHEQRGISTSIKMYEYTSRRNVAMIGLLHAPLTYLHSKQSFLLLNRLGVLQMQSRKCGKKKSLVCCTQQTVA